MKREREKNLLFDIILIAGRKQPLACDATATVDSYSIVGETSTLVPIASAVLRFLFFFMFFVFVAFYTLFKRLACSHTHCSSRIRFIHF